MNRFRTKIPKTSNKSSTTPRIRSTTPYEKHQQQLMQLQKQLTTDARRHTRRSNPARPRGQHTTHPKLEHANTEDMETTRLPVTSAQPGLLRSRIADLFPAGRRRTREQLSPSQLPPAAASQHSPSRAAPPSPTPAKQDGSSLKSTPSPTPAAQDVQSPQPFPPPSQSGGTGGTPTEMKI
jgi:hypothetical protein